MRPQKWLAFSQKIDAFSRASGRAISLLLLFLIAIVIYGSFTRYVIRDMPSWAYEVSIFIYGTFAFASGAYCFVQGKHVSVDVFKKRFSPRIQRYLDIVYNIAIFCCMACVIYYAGIWAFESTMILERSEHQTTFNPQIWWFKWIAVISILAVMLQAVSEAIKARFGVGDSAQDTSIASRERD